MRAFVAVEIEPVIREAVARLQREFSAGVRPVRPENLHITLAFLGDITESQSRQVQESLASIRFESFDLALEGAGAFPNVRSPRVIWIGTDPAGGQKLVSLAGTVRGVIPKSIQTEKRPLTPHVTALRVKGRIPGAKEILNRYERNRFGSYTVQEIKLKKSVLSPDGPTYSDILVVKGVMV